MELVLNFFSDLVLLTAGIVVVILWVIVIIVVSVEIYDLVTGNDGKKEDDNAEGPLR